MEGDVSNKTIVVLVVLTVIISVLSTFVVLGEVNGLNIQQLNQPAKTISGSSGKVSFTVTEAPQQPKPASSTGYVTFTVKPKP